MGRDGPIGLAQIRDVRIARDKVLRLLDLFLKVDLHHLLRHHELNFLVLVEIDVGYLEPGLGDVLLGPAHVEALVDGVFIYFDDLFVVGEGVAVTPELFLGASLAERGLQPRPGFLGVFLREARERVGGARPIP